MHINCRVCMQNKYVCKTIVELSTFYTMQPQLHRREKKNRRKFSEQHTVYYERAHTLLLALKSDVWEFPAGKVMAGNRVVITCANGYKPFYTRGSRQNPECLDSRAFQRGISCVPIMCPPYAGMCRLFFFPCVTWLVGVSTHGSWVMRHVAHDSWHVSWVMFCVSWLVCVVFFFFNVWHDSLVSRPGVMCHVSCVLSHVLCVYTPSDPLWHDFVGVLTHGSCGMLLCIHVTWLVGVSTHGSCLVCHVSCDICVLTYNSFVTR